MSGFETAYEYSPLPGPRHIRLLHLRPASGIDDPIYCSVETASLNEEGVDFSALSYSWALDTSGVDTPNRILSVGETSINIGQNLFEGLSRLRSIDAPLSLVLWVDAVCINQADVAERDSQVAMMADIYKRARRTLVWLGNGASEAADREASDMFERMWSCRDTYESPRADSEEAGHDWATSLHVLLGASNSVDCDVPRAGILCSCLRSLISDSTLRRCSVPRASGRPSTQDRRVQILADAVHSVPGVNTMVTRRIEALYALAFRRYWSRLWVVQELELSDQIGLFWGPFHYRHDNLLWALLVAHDLIGLVELTHKALRKSHCRVATTDLVGLETNWTDKSHPSAHIRSIWGRLDREHRLTAALKRRHELSEEMKLLLVMGNYNMQHCRDPRDRLYALLGLMDRPCLLPNYALSTVDLYTNFATRLLRVGMGIGVIASLSTKAIQKDEISASLPSWVPDFRYVPETVAYMPARWFAVCPQPLSIERDGRVYLMAYRIGTITHVDAERGTITCDQTVHSDPVSQDRCSVMETLQQKTAPRPYKTMQSNSEDMLHFKAGQIACSLYPDLETSSRFSMWLLLECWDDARDM